MKLLAQLGCQFLERSFLVLTYPFQLLVLFLKFKELLKTKKQNKNPNYCQNYIRLLPRKLLLPKADLYEKAKRQNDPSHSLLGFPNPIPTATQD